MKIARVVIWTLEEHESDIRWPLASQKHESYIRWPLHSEKHESSYWPCLKLVVADGLSGDGNFTLEEHDESH
jgi:hypothetical protein